MNNHLVSFTFILKLLSHFSEYLGDLDTTGWNIYTYTHTYVLLLTVHGYAWHTNCVSYIIPLLVKLDFIGDIFILKVYFWKIFEEEILFRFKSSPFLQIFVKFMPYSQFYSEISEFRCWMLRLEAFTILYWDNNNGFVTDDCTENDKIKM